MTSISLQCLPSATWLPGMLLPQARGCSAGKAHRDKGPDSLSMWQDPFCVSPGSKLGAGPPALGFGSSTLSASPCGKWTTFITPQEWHDSELQLPLLLAALPTGNLPELFTDSQAQPEGAFLKGCQSLCPIVISQQALAGGPAHRHLVQHDQEPRGLEGLHGPALHRSWAEDEEWWVWLGTHPWGLEGRLLGVQWPIPPTAELPMCSPFCQLRGQGLWGLALGDYCAAPRGPLFA